MIVNHSNRGRHCASLHLKTWHKMRKKRLTATVWLIRWSGSAPKVIIHTKNRSNVRWTARAPGGLWVLACTHNNISWQVDRIGKKNVIYGGTRRSKNTKGWENDYGRKVSSRVVHLCCPPVKQETLERTISLKEKQQQCGKIKIQPGKTYNLRESTLHRELKKQFGTWQNITCIDKYGFWTPYSWAFWG